jgi:hypothetical protein
MKRQVKMLIGVVSLNLHLSRPSIMMRRREHSRKYIFFGTVSVRNLEAL